MALSKQQREAKVLEFKKFHEPTFKRLGIQNPHFYPKTASQPKGFLGSVINLFESELKTRSKFFTEIVDGDYNPITPQRTLYMWENPGNKMNFRKHLGSKFEQWIVPLSEFKMVFTLQENPLPKEDDASKQQMTILDYAAIHWKKPISKKEWLNEIIRQNQ